MEKTIFFKCPGNYRCNYQNIFKFCKNDFDDTRDQQNVKVKGGHCLHLWEKLEDRNVKPYPEGLMPNQS